MTDDPRSQAGDGAKPARSSTTSDEATEATEGGESGPGASAAPSGDGGSRRQEVGSGNVPGAASSVAVVYRIYESDEDEGENEFVLVPEVADNRDPEDCLHEFSASSAEEIRLAYDGFQAGAELSDPGDSARGTPAPGLDVRASLPVSIPLSILTWSLGISCSIVVIVWALSYARAHLPW